MAKITLSSILVLGRHWTKGEQNRIYIDAWATFRLAGYKIGRTVAYDADGHKMKKAEFWRRYYLLDGAFYDSARRAFIAFGNGNWYYVNVARILGVEIVDDVDGAIPAP